MTLENALAEIRKFWTADKQFPFGASNNSQHIERLNGEFGVSMPQIVQEYVNSFAPLKDFYFTTIGNPMRVYGVDNLKYIQNGYNYNPVKKEVIEKWNSSFFIFADEGADPVIIDFDQVENGIQKLIQGTGTWDNGEIIADSFGQFLLCSAAQHHALNHFAEEPIIDDEHGFNLEDKAAKWYFQKMKVWARNYYEEWCSVFDNA